jgi:glycine/D-amino acid oxidase-like deaminating enzyme
MPDDSRRDGTTAELRRRDFLRLAGAGTGALLTAGLDPHALGAQPADAPAVIPRASRLPASGKVVIIGAGAWGAWTAWHLRAQGVDVTLVDQYGPANSRSTSGDETRGIRSSYGDRTTGEQWSGWAREAITRWREFDAEFAPRFGTRFFVTTGDVLYRDEVEPFTTRTREIWEKLKVPHEVLTAEEARKRWPMIERPDAKVVLYEPDAGVARARASIQALVGLAKDRGVKLVTGRAHPGPTVGGRMQHVRLDDGTLLTADTFVFCCGPWLRKVFPDVLGNRMRTPLGHVCYFGTPEGDARFMHPNIPSWNVPGVTGWPALPVDSRGFRVRGGFAPPPRAPREEDDDELPPGPPPPPDPRQQDPDLSVRWSSEERIAGSRRVLAAVFPALADAPLLETRACHYESSSNRNFIVDRLPGLENAWVAGVGQAEGFKFAPVVGEYAAWRVMGDSGDPALAEAFRMPTLDYEPAPNRASRQEDDA